MIATIFLSLGLIAALSSPDFTEDFSNSALTTTYDDDSYVGNNDITWNYVQSRDEADYAISGSGLMLRSLTDDSVVFSSSLPNGISDFSVKLKKGFTGTGNRQVELLVNDVSYGSSLIFDDTITHTFEVLDIDVSGAVVIKLKNIQENQIVVDDIQWTNFESSNEPSRFCAASQDYNDLDFKKIKIKNKGPSEDGDDNNWYPLDRIVIEVELENHADIEYEDIVFEIGLFEKGSESNFADEMIWISADDEEVEVGDIEEKGEDDEIEHTFEFRVNPEEIEKGKLFLMIKAYPDGDEDVTCIDNSNELTGEFGNSEFFAEIDIDKEDKDEGRAVTVDVSELDLIEASCNEEISLTVDIWNLGDEDQEQIKISLFNKALEIDIEEIIREDLDEGEKEELTFNFRIPAGLDEKTYDLEFITSYEYDDDDDEYDERSDTFHAFLSLVDGCSKEDSNVRIRADLDAETPDAISGKQVIIKAIIENTGSSKTNYVVSVSGNSAWSSLGAVDPQTVSLEAGESKDVSIYLNINPSTIGNQEFTIKVNYNDQTSEQTVRLFVEEGVTPDAVTNHFRENWFIYVIALVNIILIVAIIAVIRSMSRTPMN